MKSWVVSFGLGATVGAVAILMMPKHNLTRKLADQAANKVECAAHKLSTKLTQNINM